MSYEKDSGKEIKCPCGKGRIYIELWSYKDFNGGHHTQCPYIDCDSYEEEYHIITNIPNGQKPAMAYEYHYLVSCKK